MRPLLTTKLTPPTTARAPVPRERLDAVLERGVTGALTLVCAPAGWGKTTAVADWLRRTGRRAGWLTLDARDDDPRRLVAYLFAAAAEALPGLPLDAEGPIDALDPGTAAVALLNTLAGASGDAILVLDDAHLLASAATAELLQLLVERAPPPCTWCW